MSGYRAAVERAAIAAREDRARLRATGRDPFGMMQGLLTNSVPGSPRPVDGGTAGTAAYTAMLTPKGRMVSDGRVVRGPRADEEGLLLEVPAAARAGLMAHLAMYVPPRLAKISDGGEAALSLTVAGPAASALLSREAFGLRIEASELDALRENEWRWADTGGSGTLAVRSGELGVDAFDLVIDRADGEALRARLLEAGAAALGPDELATLRVEAGRPAWGAELDEATIPTEAGIDARAIDHAKGCYTGQEVIVRIRDRGHVNRKLRGLALGPAAPPARGTELWIAGRDTPVGSITTAAASPRAGQALALGYVRREVEPPAEVRVGGPEGPAARLVDLGADWWRV